MKTRTQILLEKKQYEGLKELAHQDGVSVSEAVRRIVQLHLDARNPVSDRMWNFVGAGVDSRSDVSENHDDYLAAITE